MTHDKYHSRWQARDQQDIEKAEDMQAAGVSGRGLPPSKRYKVDPSFSREAKAFCGNVTKLGLPPCKFGEGTYCYSRKVCSSQMDLSDPEELTPQAARLYKEESRRAILHAREVSSRMNDETTMSDEEYNRLLKRIMGE